MDGRIIGTGRWKPLRGPVNGRLVNKNWSYKKSEVGRALSGLIGQAGVVEHFIGNAMFTVNVLWRTESKRTDKYDKHKKDAKLDMLFTGHLKPEYPIPMRHQSVKPCIFLSDRLYFEK